MFKNRVQSAYFNAKYAEICMNMQNVQSMQNMRIEICSNQFRYISFYQENISGPPRIPESYTKTKKMWIFVRIHNASIGGKKLPKWSPKYAECAKSSPLAAISLRIEAGNQKLTTAGPSAR
jgi:hypothetical protein